jgi:hypothetical protein
MSFTEQQYASFFIRLWQEPREGEDRRPVWRGSIEHVQSGRKCHFRDMEIPLTFIEEVVRASKVPTKREYIA